MGARQVRKRPGYGPSGRRGVALGAKEERRLFQLAASLTLFVLVFIGRGVFPEQTAAAGAELIGTIRQSVDFHDAFERLGQALTDREPIADAVGEFCVEVFGVGSAAVPESDGKTSVFEEERVFLRAAPTGREMICRRLWLEPKLLQSAAQAEPEPSPEPVEETVLPVGAVVASVGYSGDALPENTTMDQLSLGGLNTVTPVLGVITSGFGYRDHPVYGEQKFHHGVDIAANAGTEIAAFADGTVALVGESTTYGRYIQLNHADGIVTFYAHCDSLNVQQGEQVTAGQVIAAVGESGNATGYHLHFQLSVAGTEVDPAYYIAAE